MKQTIILSAVLASLLALLTTSQAHAYGCCSRSATYSNPYTGRSGTATANTSYGPNGVTHSASASGSGPNGSYNASESRAYSPSTYSGYTAVGHTGYYGNGDSVHSATVYP